MISAAMLLRSRVGPVTTCLAACLSAMASAQTNTRRVVLPAGTVIPVRLDQNVSSRTASVGDKFSATVRFGQGDAGMPEGTRFEGVVSEVVRSADGQQGTLDMDFLRMVTLGGQSRAIIGSLVALAPRYLRHSDPGRMIAPPERNKDRPQWVGIGTGAGLLASGLTKSDGVVNAFLGAGDAYSEFDSTPAPGDVYMKAGALLGIRLDRQFAFDTNRIDDHSTSNGSAERYSPNVSGSDRDGRVDRVRAGANIVVTIDGRNVSFGSAKPFLRGEFALIPLDTVSHAAGFSYRWDDGEHVVLALNGRLRMGLGSPGYLLDGRRRSTDAAAEMRNGTLYVPLQFIGMAAGSSVDWDPYSRTVTLTTTAKR